ncbi:MAG: hypothetical protein ABIH66_04275 [bacterium]
MYRYAVSLLILLFVYSFGPVHCEAKGKTLEKVLSNAGFGYTEERFFFAREPTTWSSDIRSRNYYIGKKDGAKFYHRRNKTELTKWPPTSWFTTRVDSEEYGVECLLRLSALPKNSLLIGYGHKEIETKDYVKYMPNCANAPPGFGCPIYGQAPVFSNPFHLRFTNRSLKSWRLEFLMRRERVILDTMKIQHSETVRLYGYRAVREWNRLEAGFLFERMRPDRAPSNTHTEFGINYKFWKNAFIYAKAGKYSSGYPITGNALSDVSSQFVFNYIGDESEFKPIYTNKVGIFSLGLNYTLFLD